MDLSFGYELFRYALLRFVMRSEFVNKTAAKKTNTEIIKRGGHFNYTIRREKFRTKMKKKEMTRFASVRISYIFGGVGSRG